MKQLLLIIMLASITLLAGCHRYPPTKNGMASDDHGATNTCYVTGTCSATN